MLLITQEKRKDKEQLALPETTRCAAPEIEAWRLRAATGHLLRSNGSQQDIAAFERAVSRFLRAAP